MNKQRNSSIESLKVIGMFMIVIFHCYMTVTKNNNSFFPILEAGIIYDQLPKGLTKLVLLVAGYFGATGNLIFIISAAWFLYDSDIVRVDKVLTLILLALIISTTQLAVTSLMYPDITFSGQYIHNCFFPITYAHNWFLTCYLMLYAIHGELNRVIRGWNRKTHLLVAGIMFFMYSIVTLYAKTNFYYSTHLVSCIMIYVLTTYIKSYLNNPRMGRNLILLGNIGFVWIIILKKVGFPPSIRDQDLLQWAKYTNPFLILIVVGITVIVAGRCFYNNIVNSLSSMSLELYLIHENLTFRSVVRPMIWNDLSTRMGDPLLTRFLLFSLLILAYGLGASILFSTFFTPRIRLLAKWLACRLNGEWEKLTSRF